MINYKTIKNYKLDKIGFFRFKKFDKDRYLITNDIGYFSFLNILDFSNFISGKIKSISKNKYLELENKLFIKQDNYVKDLSLGYYKKNGFIKQGPSLHIIVTTLRCNHACRYCHAYRSNEVAEGKDMTIDTAKKVVDTIFFTTSNNITIEFQGGEPLLNFEVLKFIVNYARNKAIYLKKNLSFALVTNLSLMDEEKLAFLIENNINISTSLDLDEKTHNYNRVYIKGNSFERVKYWIKKITSEYKKRGIPMKIGALTTVTNKTLSKYKELIDTYLSLGLDSVFLRPLNPYGFAEKNFKEIGYTYQEFNQFYNKSIDYILQLNKKGLDFKESLTTIYLQKILNAVDPNFMDERSPCGAAIGQVAYNYNGNIYTCDEGRMFGEIGDESFYIGTLIDDGKQNYINMINNNTTKTMIKASNTESLPGYRESVYKPYIGICPIYSYNKSGNIFSNYSLDNRIKMSYNILDFIFSKIDNENYLKIFKKWIGNDN